MNPTSHHKLPRPRLEERNTQKLEEGAEVLVKSNKYKYICNKLSLIGYDSTDQMGSLGGAIPAHRLSHQQILGHTRTLCLALADAKIQCIRGLIRDKKFIKDLIFTLKHLVIILAMSLVSEIACLRLVTVLLLIVLTGLSFYILYDALTRCREIESKLTHEISEMSLLTTDDSDTENEE